MERTVSGVSYRPITRHSLLRRILRAVLEFDRHNRDRVAMGNLSSSLRRDIGLTEHSGSGDARVKWQAPHHWTLR